MGDMGKEIDKIQIKLELIFDHLVSGLNAIYKKGIPSNADKLVIWIPLGSRYNLSFTYMKNNACDIQGDYSELSACDHVLEKLLGNIDLFDLDFQNELSLEADELVAKWLKLGLESSLFRDVNLPKIMAINNVCAYFDLETIELIEDEDMWD